MNPDNQVPQKPVKNSYAKRPMWQWVVLYLVVGAVVYFLVYLLFLRDSSGGIY